jgi:GPI mannosyltransferase 3
MKLKYVCLLSIVILVIAAIFSTGYYHFDEHFQILEFAGLKLKMNVAENLPWEYTYKMRPMIQPALVVAVFQFLNLFSISNPFLIATILRLLSASIAFMGMFLIYKTYIKTIKDSTLKHWFLVLSFLLWFMIFNNVRFSSENWSGSIFLISFALLGLKQSPKPVFYLLTGMLLGLAFLFRYQTGFLIAGLLLWQLLIQKRIGNTILLIFGALILFGTGVIIDKWFYGEWTITTWNYFNQNILQNRVSDFGIHPWWFYLERTFIQGIPPFSIIIIAGFALLFIYRRKDVLTWTLLPFLLIHFLIGHKEIRFLFPIIGFIPVVIIKSSEIIQSRWYEAFTENKLVRLFARLFLIFNIIFLIIITFSPADSQIALYKKIYSGYKSPTILYYIDDNPYRRVLDIYFYKRSNLDIVKVGSFNEVDYMTKSNLLIVTRDTSGLNEIKYGRKMIYSSYPEWIRTFNFNNWMARANIWYVFELNKSDK